MAVQQAFPITRHNLARNFSRRDELFGMLGPSSFEAIRVPRERTRVVPGKRQPSCALICSKWWLPALYGLTGPWQAGHRIGLPLLELGACAIGTSVQRSPSFISEHVIIIPTHGRVVSLPIACHCRAFHFIAVCAIEPAGIGEGPSGK